MKAGIDFFWQYVVEITDELNDYKLETEEGLVVADTWAEAVERIVGYYGETELCTIKHLEGFEFGTGLITREDFDTIIWKVEKTDD